MPKENNDWIKEAFKRAEIEAEKAKEVGGRIEKHLEGKTDGLLEMWGKIIGDNASCKIALMLNDKDFMNAFMELSKCFFIAGYLSGLDDVKNDQIKIQ